MQTPRSGIRLVGVAWVAAQMWALSAEAKTNYGCPGIEFNQRLPVTRPRRFGYEPYSVVNDGGVVLFRIVAPQKVASSAVREWLDSIAKQRKMVFASGVVVRSCDLASLSPALPAVQSCLPIGAQRLQYFQPIQQIVESVDSKDVSKMSYIWSFPGSVLQVSGVDYAALKPEDVHGAIVALGPCKQQSASDGKHVFVPTFDCIRATWAISSRGQLRNPRATGLVLGAHLAQSAAAKAKPDPERIAAAGLQQALRLPVAREPKGGGCPPQVLNQPMARLTTGRRSSIRAPLNASLPALTSPLPPVLLLGRHPASRFLSALLNKLAVGIRLLGVQTMADMLPVATVLQRDDSGHAVGPGNLFSHSTVMRHPWGPKAHAWRQQHLAEILRCARVHGLPGDPMYSQLPPAVRQSIADLGKDPGLLSRSVELNQRVQALREGVTVASARVSRSQGTQHKEKSRAAQDKDACPGGMCWPASEGVSWRDVATSLILHYEPSARWHYDAAYRWRNRDPTRDPCLVCLTRVVLRAVAQGLDPARVGTPDAHGNHPWDLIEGHFYPQHLQARNSLPRAMHEPGPGNGLPAQGVRRPWLQQLQQSQIGRWADKPGTGDSEALGGPGMPVSVDLVMVDGGSRGALWEGVSRFLRKRVLGPAQNWGGAVTEAVRAGGLQGVSPGRLGALLDVGSAEALLEAAGRLQRSEMGGFTEGGGRPDDVFRTGANVRSAIRLVEAAGPGAVRDFMAAYGQDFDYLGLQPPSGWNQPR